MTLTVYETEICFAYRFPKFRDFQLSGQVTQHFMQYKNTTQYNTLFTSILAVVKTREHMCVKIKYLQKKK